MGNEKKPFLRDLLSTAIIISGIGYIFMITINLTYFQDIDFEEFKELITIFLPVIAAWVGTVIAYHFGKENFDAVTKSYNTVVDKLTLKEKMATISVKEAMLKFKLIEHIIFDDKTMALKLYDIINDPKFGEYQRIAFLTQKRIFKYIIHKSTFNHFLVNKAVEIELQKNEKGVIKKVTDLTFSDLIKDSDEYITRMLKKSVQFVPITATLLEAKKSMDMIPECLDVFVTENGTANEPILGLITNNLLLEMSDNYLNKK